MIQKDTQRDAMQWLSTQIPRGHLYWWTSDVIPTSNLESLALKLNDRYGTMAAPMVAYRNSRKGITRARVVSAPLPDGSARFVLIADGPIEREQMRDARTHGGRLVWSDYIFLLTTKPRELGGGTHWSWHLLPQVRDDIEHYGAYLIKSNPGAVTAFWDKQLNRPMFAGTRSQVAAMLRSQAKLWSRIRTDQGWPGPDPNKSLPYVGTFRRLEKAPG